MSEATSGPAIPHIAALMRATNTVSRSRDGISAELFNFRFAPLKRGRGEDRVRAAPEVSCALMHKEKCAHEHTGEAGASRPSLRNGFTTYTCSPWRPGFLVTITGVMRE